MTVTKEQDAFEIAHQQIAIERIAGEPINYKDTLCIVREVAMDALKELGRGLPSAS
jgi:hypothetical protein